MGNKEVETFLSHLAVSRGVSAATQYQALCAIVFMYKHVLERELKELKFYMDSHDNLTVNYHGCPYKPI